MVDGHPLEEYDDPDAVTDTTEISKYVEAPSDKDFWFRITELEKPTAPFEDLRVAINIDGVWAKGKIFDRSQYCRGHVEDLTHNSAGQKFHFAALEIGSWPRIVSRISANKLKTRTMSHPSRRKMWRRRRS